MFTKEFSSESLPFRFGVLASRHERRRRGGLPTVTTLVGPIDLGKHLWQVWTAQHHRPCVMTIGGSRGEWLGHWTAALLAERDLYVDAEHYLAARYTQLNRSDPPLHLRHKTLFEIETILERAQLFDCGLEPDRLCAWLLRQRARSAQLSTEHLVAQQLRWCESSSFSIDHAFRQVTRFLGSEAMPALLVIRHDTASEQGDSTVAGRCISELNAVAEELAKLATCAPELTVALAVDGPLWHAYSRQSPESFAKAVIHENAISLDDLQFETFPPLAAPEGESRRRDFVSCHTATAASDITVSSDDDHRDVASPLRTMHSIDQLFMCKPPASCTDEPWNSEYERFLFELLEDCDDLRGLFQLNVDAGFRFGHKPIEVDLACLSLRIAIEIDGYFHFLHPESYRRDRRKDVVLQRNGYIVLRFLTADIVADIPTILDGIRAEVQFRQAQMNVASQKVKGHDAL